MPERSKTAYRQGTFSLRDGYHLHSSERELDLDRIAPESGSSTCDISPPAQPEAHAEANPSSEQSIHTNIRTLLRMRPLYDAKRISSLAPGYDKWLIHRPGALPSVKGTTRMIDRAIDNIENQSCLKELRQLDPVLLSESDHQRKRENDKPSRRKSILGASSQPYEKEHSPRRPTMTPNNRRRSIRRLQSHRSSSFYGNIKKKELDTLHQTSFLAEYDEKSSVPNTMGTGMSLMSKIDFLREFTEGQKLIEIQDHIRQLQKVNQKTKDHVVLNRRSQAKTSLLKNRKEELAVKAQLRDSMIKKAQSRKNTLLQAQDLHRLSLLNRDRGDKEESLRAIRLRKRYYYGMLLVHLSITQIGWRKALLCSRKIYEQRRMDRAARRVQHWWREAQRRITIFNVTVSALLVQRLIRRKQRQWRQQRLDKAADRIKQLIRNLHIYRFKQVVAKCKNNIRICQKVWRGYKKITKARVRLLMLLWNRYEKEYHVRHQRRVLEKISKINEMQQKESLEAYSVLKHVATRSSIVSDWKEIAQDPHLINRTQRLVSIDQQLVDHLRTSRKLSKTVGQAHRVPKSIKVQLLEGFLMKKRRQFQEKVQYNPCFISPQIGAKQPLPLFLLLSSISEDEMMGLMVEGEQLDSGNSTSPSLN